jgi:NADH:ubiquinone oxidoreductase subunit 5 (subunit L)/multisubunit Na+/H+ antiporter MnhA subunit
MIMNRIADVFFIIAILIFYIHFNTLDYIVLFSLIPFYSEYKITFMLFELNIIDVISFFLFIGAIGKSAQIGLHT